jgi:membrane protein
MNDPEPAAVPAPRRKSIQDRREAAQERFAGTWAESIWSRLNSLDFINKGILLAAVLLLCFFPFIIVLNALAGRSAVTGFSRRLGLNHQAAAEVSHIFAPASSTSSAVSGTGYVLFVLGGIAAAGAIENLYEQVFGLEPRGMQNLPRRLIWLAVLIGGALISASVGPALGNDGGPVLLAVVGFIVFVFFWWFTMWLLSAGRIPWRDALPSAIATAICWVGMAIVFHFVFSNMVIGNDKKYGPIGVVLAFMSYLIAIGVVIILGSIVGVVWNERKSPTKSDAQPSATLDHRGSNSSG